MNNLRVRDFFESVLLALFLAVFIRTFFLTAYKIPTSSMAPTLLPGDFVFSNKFPFGLRIPFTSLKFGGRIPLRGELVIFKYPENPKTTFVKRVVGLPGDHIEIKEKVLYINDVSVPLVESSEINISALPGSAFLKIYREAMGGNHHYVMYSEEADTPHSLGPFIVPQHQVFLMGDNRDASDDSRYWGSVPIDQIEGKVFLVWLSLDWNDDRGQRQLPRIRTERLFKTLY